MNRVRRMVLVSAVLLLVAAGALPVAATVLPVGLLAGSLGRMEAGS